MRTKPKVYNQAELKAAFDRVCRKDNWKMPIDAKVTLKREEFDLIIEAVIHFTGSAPTFLLLYADTYRVRAAGYYNTIGA